MTGLPIAARRSVFACRRDPCRSTPLVECVKDVRFAEIDAHGPPARPLGVIALEVSIDPAECHFERHALRGPRGDEIE